MEQILQLTVLCVVISALTIGFLFLYRFLDEKWENREKISKYQKELLKYKELMNMMEFELEVGYEEKYSLKELKSFNLRLKKLVKINNTKNK